MTWLQKTYRKILLGTLQNYLALRNLKADKLSLNLSHRIDRLDARQLRRQQAANDSPQAPSATRLYKEERAA